MSNKSTEPSLMPRGPEDDDRMAQELEPGRPACDAPQKRWSQEEFAGFADRLQKHRRAGGDPCLTEDDRLMAIETIETMLALRRELERPDATEADVVALLHRSRLPLREMMEAAAAGQAEKEDAEGEAGS